MPNAFYTNYTDLKFIDKLKKNIDTCKAFYFSVSFIKKVDFFKYRSCFGERSKGEIDYINVPELYGR